MSERDQYRAKAKYCREMADQAISPLDKDAWLKLAADWLAMASMRERSIDRFNAQERDRGTGQSKTEAEH
jgi:hypothetical protein